MFVDPLLNGFRIEIVIDAGFVVEDDFPYVIDALALEPRCIRRRKTLLHAACDILRDVSFHNLTEDNLSIPVLLKVKLLFGPWVVFVDA